MKKKKHILTLFQFTHWCIHEIVHNETKTSLLHLQYIWIYFWIYNQNIHMFGNKTTTDRF